MVKLVDTRDLKSLAARCPGSTPGTRTKLGLVSSGVERLVYTERVGRSKRSRGTTAHGELAERLRQQFAKLSLGNRWIGSIPILSAIFKKEKITWQRQDQILN